MAARTAYAVLTQAMRSQHQAALGRLVLSGRRQLALLRPMGALLLLHLLHYPAQVRSGASLEAELRGQLVGALEARLAGELIDAYHQPPCWRDYVDDSAQALQTLVQARLQGQKPAEPDLQPTTPPTLLDTLRQSVAALRDKSATDGVGHHQAGPSRRNSS